LDEEQNKIPVTITVTTISLYMQVSRPALEPTQPPSQWVPGDLYPGVQWQVREAERSPPSGAEKNGEATTPFPHASSSRGAYLYLSTAMQVNFSARVPYRLNTGADLIAFASQQNSCSLLIQNDLYININYKITETCPCSASRFYCS
jgi:hypothetical protein